MARILSVVLAIIISIPILSSAAYSVQFDSENGIIWYDCKDINAVIEDSDGTELFNATDFFEEIASGSYNLTIDDVDNCQGVIPTTPELPNLIPAPSENFTTIDLEMCQQTGFLSMCEGTYVSGNLIVGDDTADVFAINVTKNSVLHLTLLASSSALDVKFHYQNSSDNEELSQEISIEVNTSHGSNHNTYIPIGNDGRIIVSVTSPSVENAWAIRTKLFDTSQPVNLDNVDDLSGVGNLSFYYNLPVFESLVLENSQTEYGEEIELTYRFVYEQGVYSEWFSVNQSDRIKSITESQYIEMIWNCECKWYASFTKHRHYDAGIENDAPGLRPLTPTSDNSSYPLIVMDGRLESAELTLNMNDYRDIFRIETTGWNESIHLVDVIVEGDIYDIQVTIWDIDQNSWEVLNSITKTYSMNEIRVALNVARGTHFIRVEHINGSDSLGEDSISIEYTIRINTAVIDEGEEPWFPASDAVKDAANVFYWLMGLILILPFIIFIIQQKRDKSFAMEFASKQDRLSWLSQRLDRGEDITSDLSRALRTMSNLEWEQSLEVWGEPSLRHLTNGIDLAMWKMDDRIADKGGLPLLIGIRPNENEWSVAAIRFEAPEGEPWTVSNVNPKLLFRGDEIFLDTISVGTRVFIQVDLKGKSKSVDIHLSGMMENEPIAAKPSNTMLIDTNHEEE